MKINNNIKVNEQSYCGCGCGQIVKRKYAWGHYIRIKNPNVEAIILKQI
jgi:hypothetical protein